ncbi:MAG: hypothetical protein IPN34_27615 [Planctomycetes bacterium]|nr:hypothetical protein [Planctomycetota bacterium]
MQSLLGGQDQAEAQGSELARCPALERDALLDRELAVTVRDRRRQREETAPTPLRALELGGSLRGWTKPRRPIRVEPRPAPWLIGQLAARSGSGGTPRGGEPPLSWGAASDSEVSKTASVSGLALASASGTASSSRQRDGSARALFKIEDSRSGGSQVLVSASNH